MCIHIIYSNEEQKYLLLDSDNNVVDKATTHEEAMLLADKHEAMWIWCDELSFVLG